MPARDPDPDPDPDFDADARPSKSQRKRESTAVQDLGAELVHLSAARLQALALPETLREALLTYRNTRTHEGRRRQMQYIGKLMRHVDTAPLAEAVAETRLGSARATLALHRAEKWREDLVADDDAVTRWITEHPDCDAQHFRTLVRRARLERQAQPPEAAAGEGLRQGKAWRELFRAVRSGLDAVDAVPT
jgi:ribosome-associated protein